MKLLIEANTEYDFKRRAKSSSNVNIIVVVILGTAAFIGTSNILVALILGVILLMLYNSSSSKSNLYFIKKIQIDDENNLEIIFFERDIEKSIKDKLVEFDIKKKFALESTNIIYLVVKYKNKILLKQYQIDPWDEKLLDEVVNCYKDNV